MTIQVVLLCGGRGERLRPLTDVAPKPGLLIGGRPWLDRVIEEYAKHDLRKFLLVAGYKGEQIVQMYAEWGQWRGLEISVVVEPQPMGTFQALNWLHRRGIDTDRVLLANGDTLVQTETRLQNCSGRALAFRIGGLDCGVRLFRTDVLHDALGRIPIDTPGKIEDALFPRLALKWQNLDKASSRFIDIGTMQDYERAKVIFR